MDYRLSMDGTARKRPFLTWKGYLGLSPVVAEPGDLVAIFMGSWIPHLVRHQEGKRYSFQGEEYRGDVMDGELVGKAREETFMLS
jgi:hypothetical protein